MEKDIVLLIAGSIVGLMNAVAGGGMLVGLPVLVALGIPPLAANATSSIINSTGQLASSWGYRKYLRQVPGRFAILVPPLVIGAAIGTIFLRHTPAHDFARIIPLLVLFGVGLFALQPILHFHVHQHLRGKHKTISPLLLIALAMLPLSLYGGYFGAGFGFLMLAFLGFTTIKDTQTITAMKNVGGVFVSGTSLFCLLSTHLINWRAGLIMAAGAVAGGYVGSRFSQRLSSHWLRIVVVAIGLGAVVYLALKRY